MNAEQSREFIRHPSSVPLEIAPHSAREQLNLKLNNVSIGGLSFDSPVQLDEGTVVRIKIPTLKPVFIVNAIVEWCEAHLDRYELGVRFLDKDDVFRVRMIEQICHIEEYRKELQRKIGKRVTKNRASAEWIEKYGQNFPRPH